MPKSLPKAWELSLRRVTQNDTISKMKGGEKNDASNEQHTISESQSFSGSGGKTTAAAEKTTKPK